MPDRILILLGLLGIVMFLALCAAIHQYWVERGREEWDNFLDGFGHD